MKPLISDADQGVCRSTQQQEDSSNGEPRSYLWGEGKLLGSKSGYRLVSYCAQGTRGLILQLNGDLLLNEDVGAGPLMFDTTADIEIGVVVGELEDVGSEDVEFASRVTEADVVAARLLVEPLPLSPPLLSPDCVGVLEGLAEASVMVDDGVVGPSRLCK